MDVMKFDRSYHTSHRDFIDLCIPDPPPSKNVTLHHCAAQDSTAKKIAVHYNYCVRRHGIRPGDVLVSRLKRSCCNPAYKDYDEKDYIA